MSTHELFCCPICEEPISITNRNGKVEKRYKPASGIVVMLGYSHGGWGSRENWIDYSNVICADCFATLEAMFAPAVEFIRSHGRRKGDQVSSVRSDEPSSAGREQPLLRALPSLRGKG